jgi:NADH-quinone oxidoreductase subunit M
MAYGTMTYAVIAAIGIVLGAAYLLWLYQRVFWGPLDNPENAKVSDVNRRELGMMLALIALMVWIGVYPKPIFDIMEKPVDYIVEKVDPQYFARNPVTYPAEPVAAPAEQHHEVAAK